MSDADVRCPDKPLRSDCQHNKCITLRAPPTQIFISSLTRHPPPQLDAAVPRGRQKLIGGPQVQARHCIAVPCKSPQLAPRAWGIGIHVTVVGACQQHCRGVSLLCICGHDGCQRGQGDLTQLQGAHLQSQHKRAAGLTVDVVQMLEADQAPG